MVLSGVPLALGGKSRTLKITAEMLMQQLKAQFPGIDFAMNPRTITPASNPTPFPLWLLTLGPAGLGLAEDEHTPNCLVLFERDCGLRPYRSSNASKHCGKCLSWHHSTSKCRAPAPVCARCGLTGHTAETHTCSICKPGEPPECVPECFHCKGPGVTGHPGCTARPIWHAKVKAVIVPEGERLQRIQLRGRTDRKAAILRAKAAASAPPLPPTTMQGTSTGTPRAEASRPGTTPPAAAGGNNNISLTAGAPADADITMAVEQPTSTSASGPRINALGGN